MIVVTVPEKKMELPVARAMCAGCKAFGPAVECAMPKRRHGYTSYADHQLAVMVSGFFHHQVPSESAKGKSRGGLQIDYLCSACARELYEQTPDGTWLRVKLAAHLGLPVATCSECQAKPAMPCRDCGVLLCESHGMFHSTPDCEVAFAAYVRDVGAASC